MINYWLGILYEKDNNFEESIYHLKKGRELCCEDDMDNLVPICITLSRVYDKAEKYEEALLCNKSLICCIIFNDIDVGFVELLIDQY